MPSLHFVRIRRHFWRTAQSMRSRRHFINLCPHTAVAMVVAACGLNLAMRAGRHGCQNGAQKGLKDRAAHQDSDGI